MTLNTARNEVIRKSQEWKTMTALLKAEATKVEKLAGKYFGDDIQFSLIWQVKAA